MKLIIVLTTVFYVSILATEASGAPPSPSLPKTDSSKHVVWKPLTFMPGISGYSLSVHPESNVLLYGSVESIVLWDMDREDKSRVLIDKSGKVYSTCFSRDGKIFATGLWVPRGDEAGVLTLRKTDTGATLWSKKAHLSNVCSLDFSPNGSYVASGSWDDTAKIWNVRNGELVQTLLGHKSSVNCLRFTPDGKNIVTGSSDGSVMLWSVRSGRVISSLIENPKDQINSLCISPDEKWLASGSREGKVYIWSLKNLKLQTTLNLRESSITSLTFSADSTLLAVGAHNDDTIRVFDPESGILISSVREPGVDDIHGIAFVQFQNEGVGLICLPRLGDLVVLNILTGEVLQRDSKSEGARNAEQQ